MAPLRVIRNHPRLLWRALSALVLMCGLLSASIAAADAASGTYTGSVAVRGNYYWEKSTRVVAPSAAVNLATPSGVRVEASYLLDAITSASTATGVTVDQAFTEKRNEGQAGIGYEVDFGETQLDVSVRGRYSKEPDYRSRGVGFGAALSLDQRNTLLHLNGYVIDDAVSKIVRGPTPGRPDRISAQRAERQGDLQALSLGVAWDQVLSHATTLTLGYDAAFLRGFQANPYRIVMLTDGGQRPEVHPGRRGRHAGYLWLSHFVMRTRTALKVGYRLYYDSWELMAHAPELRLHQEIGPHVEIRLRYRFYTQASSFFFDPGRYASTDAYVTADPKMSRFHNQTFGIKVRVALDFLAFTALDALRTAVLDWSVEYVLNDYAPSITSYGPYGMVAQGGLLWPF